MVVVASVGAAPHAVLALAQRADAPAPEVRVAVVVDLGPHAVSPRFIVRCLKVPAGTNGSVVLASVTSSLHVAAPTYAVSGLLCSIDGYPSSGCGTPGRGGYAYWSYWHGVAGHWSYADVGPAEWTVRDEDVEGWRFESHGTAGPADPVPGSSATYRAVCALAATAPAPVATSGGSTSGSVPLDVAVALVALALGGMGAVQWRRRART